MVQIPETGDMTVKQLQDICYSTAVEKGWWENSERNFPEILALIHSELSEALEEYRNGHPVEEVRIENGKPEGVPIELVDAIIRIFDHFGRHKIDATEMIRMKMKYNATRPYRHGGKKA